MINPSAPRTPRQILDAYYATHGTEVQQQEGANLIAALGRRIGSTTNLTVGNLEDALGAIHRLSVIGDNSVGLWNGAREVWPNELDYAAVKADHLDKQDQLITCAMRALIPGGK